MGREKEYDEREMNVIMKREFKVTKGSRYEEKNKNLNGCATTKKKIKDWRQEEGKASGID